MSQKAAFQNYLLILDIRRIWSAPETLGQDGQNFTAFFCLFFRFHQNAVLLHKDIWHPDFFLTVLNIFFTIWFFHQISQDSPRIPRFSPIIWEHFRLKDQKETTATVTQKKTDPSRPRMWSKYKKVRRIKSFRSSELSSDRSVKTPRPLVVD